MPKGADARFWDHRGCRRPLDAPVLSDQLAAGAVTMGERLRRDDAVGIAAVTAGSRSFAAIGQWAADAGAGVLAGLGAVRGPAEESGFRRAFALVSTDVPGPGEKPAQGACRAEDRDARLSRGRGGSPGSRRGRRT
jgi:hypothetical protein